VQRRQLIRGAHFITAGANVTRKNDARKKSSREKTALLPSEKKVRRYFFCLSGEDVPDENKNAKTGIFIGGFCIFRHYWRVRLSPPIFVAQKNFADY
jgi:hypothetical protein